MHNNSHTNQQQQHKIAPNTLMRMIKGNEMDERTHSRKFIITLHFTTLQQRQMNQYTFGLVDSRFQQKKRNASTLHIS